MLGVDAIKGWKGWHDIIQKRERNGGSLREEHELL